MHALKSIYDERILTLDRSISKQSTGAGDSIFIFISEDMTRSLEFEKSYNSGTK
jgi:hypothetical protein